MGKLSRIFDMMQLKTSLKYIKRSPYQAINAILVITLTIFLTSGIFATGYTSQKILSFYESKPQINVFFKDGMKSEDIDNLKKGLMDLGKVSKVKFVSKKDALEIYRQQNRNDPLLLEMVTENILPASLEISATDARYLTDINEILKKETGIEEIVYQKDVIDTLLKWTSAIRNIGIVVILYLMITSILTIVTIVGTKIAARKEEIEVLKLIGASNWYIRRPFIIEAMILGSFSAIFSWFIFYVCLLFTFPSLSAFFSEIGSSFPLFFLMNPPLSVPGFLGMLKILFLELIFGLFVSSLAGIIAATRYLKE